MDRPWRWVTFASSASSSLLLLLATTLASAIVSGDLYPAGDAAALLALKSSVDHQGALTWSNATAGELCSRWTGVLSCSPDGHVTKLVLESLNLSGGIPTAAIVALSQLRVLSFKSNFLSGTIPALSPLRNLKILYLNNNRFSGEIPADISVLHRLKIVVLSDNLLSGAIPPTMSALPLLYKLYLQNNSLSGTIPPFNQSSLLFFNVSDNNLSGEIPKTKALSFFNLFSFVGNPRLCGAAVNVPCISPRKGRISPAPSPAHHNSRKKKKKNSVIYVVVGSISGSIVLLAVFFLLMWSFKKRSNVGAVATNTGERKLAGDGGDAVATESKKEDEFTWEEEGNGKLVFCGGGREMYGMDDLLRASAETMGRGTLGSTYKAVMESAFIVTVKRLKETCLPEPAEFWRRMAELGALRHPNLVALRAYFQAKEERLLVYDYFPNGSLFSLIHGSRPSGRGKPLHWTSCLKIAEDVAAGLLYLHQQHSSSGEGGGGAVIVHGNLKSSNVLLGPDFESCLTDYGLAAPAGTSPSSDIHAFGLLLLELLTGNTAPFKELVEEHGGVGGEMVPRWVRSAREENSSGGDEEGGGSGGRSSAAEEKLAALLRVATACVDASPEARPPAREVLKMIREARAEALVSSNSSDQCSPGRWSDTVQSLPRDLHGSEHLSFTERD